MITFTPPLTTTMFSPLGRLQRLDLVADVAPLQARGPCGTAPRRRESSGLGVGTACVNCACSTAGVGSIGRFTTCGCGPKRARPRATIGGGSCRRGLRRRQLEIDVAARREPAEPGRRFQPVAARIGLSSPHVRATPPAADRRSKYAITFVGSVGLCRGSPWSIHSTASGPRMSVSPCSHAAIAAEMPNVVHALLPMLRLVGRDADRRSFIRPRQRDRFLGDAARRDDTAPQRREQNRLGAHRERRGSTASTEARATCVSSRRSDWHPCQSVEKRASVCGAARRLCRRASTQAEAPPAITKKPRRKLRRIIRATSREGSSRVRGR